MNLEKENKNPENDGGKGFCNQVDSAENKNERGTVEVECSQQKHRIPEADDFTLLKPISRGAFGKVFIGCKKKNPDKIYAIKVMKKTDLINKNLIAQVTTERDALAMIHSPFVVEIYYSLQSEQNIYLVMEYLSGGDVKSLLAAFGYLSEDVATMYIAEVTLALEHLHRKGIIHRDLKPDNMLIAANGHLKLTDFGLSKVTLDVNTTPVPPSQMTPMSRLDQYRTPGQILSLRSSLAFSAPRSGGSSRGSAPSSAARNSRSRKSLLSASSPRVNSGSCAGALSPLVSSPFRTSDAAGSKVLSLQQRRLTAHPRSSPRTPKPALITTPPIMKSLTPTLQDSLGWKHSSSLDDAAPPPLPSHRLLCHSSSVFAGDISHIHHHHHHRPLHDSSISSNDDVFSSTHHDLKDISVIIRTPGAEKEHCELDCLSHDRASSRQESLLDSTPLIHRTDESVYNSYSARNLRSFREGSPLEDEGEETSEGDFSPLQHRVAKLESVPEESESQPSSQGSVSDASQTRDGEPVAGPQPNRKRSFDTVMGEVACPSGSSHTGLTQEVFFMCVGKGQERSRSNHRSESDPGNPDCLELTMEYEEGAMSRSDHAPRKIRITSKDSTSSESNLSSPPKLPANLCHTPKEDQSMPLPGFSLSGLFSHSLVSSPETETEDPNTSVGSEGEVEMRSIRPFRLFLPKLELDSKAAKEDVDVCTTCTSLKDRTCGEKGATPFVQNSVLSEGKEDSVEEKGDCNTETGKREDVLAQRDTDLAVAENEETEKSGEYASLGAVPNTPAVKPSHRPPKNVEFKEATCHQICHLSVPSINVSHEGLIGSDDSMVSTDYKTPERPHNCRDKQVTVHNDFITPQRPLPSIAQPLRTPKEGVRRGPEPKSEAEERILGTPDYLAPEILRQEKHGPAVDWWALGVCLFEFLTGLPPFNDETPELVFNNILNRAISWPTDMCEIGEEAQYAINALLTMDPKKRATAPQVKAMALFSKLDWDHLLESEPPFIPQPDDILDTSYFDPKNTMQQLTISAVDL